MIDLNDSEGAEPQVIDPADDASWDELWPEPDPGEGDGSEFAETTADDGTPGSVA